MGRRTGAAKMGPARRRYLPIDRARQRQSAGCCRVGLDGHRDVCCTALPARARRGPPRLRPISAALVLRADIVCAPLWQPRAVRASDGGWLREGRSWSDLRVSRGWHDGAVLVAVLVMVGLVAPVVVGEVIVGGWVVHAHSGERLPGAMVSLFCGRKFPLTSQWTDTEGAFVFRGAPAGRCTLFAALGTHMPRVRLDLRPGERRLLDVPLDPMSKRGDYWTLKYSAPRPRRPRWCSAPANVGSSTSRSTPTASRASLRPFARSRYAKATRSASPHHTVGPPNAPQSARRRSEAQTNARRSPRRSSEAQTNARRPPRRSSEAQTNARRSPRRSSEAQTNARRPPRCSSGAPTMPARRTRAAEMGRRRGGPRRARAGSAVQHTSRQPPSPTRQQPADWRCRARSMGRYRRRAGPIFAAPVLRPISPRPALTPKPIGPRTKASANQQKRPRRSGALLRIKRSRPSCGP